jgi:hypothetical protein
VVSDIVGSVKEEGIKCEGKEKKGKKRKTYPSSMARAHNSNSPTSFLNGLTGHLVILYRFLKQEGLEVRSRDGMHDDILCTGRRFGAGMSGPGGGRIGFIPISGADYLISF